MIISKSYKTFSAKLAEHYYLQAFKVCINFDVLNSAPYLRLANFTGYEVLKLV